MILVTGGSGFIGSSVVDLLLKQTLEKIVILDKRMNKWTYELFAKHHDRIDDRIVPILMDITNESDRNRWIIYPDLLKENISTIIHLAGHISVSESVTDPIKYYDDNVNGMLYVIELARKYNSNIIFSSSAGVYAPSNSPVNEFSFKEPIHPYGQTKLWCEQILEAADRAYGIKSCVFRYFNAAGMGDNHGYYERANHAIPALMNAIKRNDTFYINGNDYHTNHDKTCVRDYLHIKDIARAHIDALTYLENKTSITVNLGSGMGTSMLELVDKAESILQKRIKHEFRERRAGDPPHLVADITLANKLLGWYPKFGLNDIISDAWKWEETK